MTKDTIHVMHLEIDIYQDVDTDMSCVISSDNSTGVTYPLSFEWPLSRCITDYMNTLLNEEIENMNKEEQNDIVVE